MNQLKWVIFFIWIFISNTESATTPAPTPTQPATTANPTNVTNVTNPDTLQCRFTKTI